MELTFAPSMLSSGETIAWVEYAGRYHIVIVPAAGADPESYIPMFLSTLGNAWIRITSRLVTDLEEAQALCQGHLDHAQAAAALMTARRARIEAEDTLALAATAEIEADAALRKLEKVPGIPAYLY
jgi:hypothetical protein